MSQQLALAESGSAAAPAVRQVVRKKAYAELRKCAPSYISKLIREGKLTPPAITADGLIDVALANQQIAAHRDPSRAPGASALPAPSLGGLTVDPEPASFAAHKSRRESTLADLAEIELAKKRGELIDRQSVFDVFFELGVLVRDSLTARISELALSLVGLDEAAIAARLQEADRKTLEAIADTAKQKAGTLADA